MRILVVDDEVNLANAIKQGLEAEGFVVDVAHDGEEALWAATEQAYDIVVLDLMLPKLNGYKVVERLRHRGVWTPILMLTAKDGEYDQADALDLGADDYLTKPFDFPELEARIALLEYLMRNPGKVVSKSELLDHVWDTNFDGPLNVVEVYVGYLRKKIDAPFGVQSLATVRGFGYRLDPVDAPPSARTSDT